ncbi:MAG TPA: hypothetical protein DD417_17595 [Elusimicrobia bacterium]|nr:hypothetical protein [Elusimicrobiota bacterium]
MLEARLSSRSAACRSGLRLDQMDEPETCSTSKKTWEKDNPPRRMSWKARNAAKPAARGSANAARKKAAARLPPSRHRRMSPAGTIDNPDRVSRVAAAAAAPAPRARVRSDRPGRVSQYNPTMTDKPPRA